MTQDSERLSGGASRRKFIVSAGAVGSALLAGCQGDSNTGNGDGGPTSGGGTGADPATTDQPDQSLATDTLTGDGSSTVFPITNTAASFWNSNPETGDGDYWPAEWADQYGTDKRLADYFAGLYGWEATGERSVPPFRVSIALSHSGTGVEGVMEDRVDIGDSSAPAAAELEGESVPESEMEKFVDHVVGVDGQPIVVSKEIHDAGLREIDIDELKAIYKGEVDNWSEVGGPDREMLVLGRANNSGTATSFRSNVYGDPNASTSPDQRYGKNQQLQQAVASADNAISYLALAFVQPEGSVPPIGLRIGDTTYEYGKNLGAKEYPLSRDLHAYTWENTSRQEAAFINLVLSDFGQEFFVKSNNYFALPQDRLETQRAKVAASKYE